jgi:uncharacterized protein (DUF1501 family)
MYPQRQPDSLVNIAATQSLAVKSRLHTPLVFDEPERFQRQAYLSEPVLEQQPADGNLGFLRAVNASAQASSQRVAQAWRDYTTPVDYGIAPMDLPKVAACIQAGLTTQLYYVSFRNNAFDTHVQQPDLHQRLLSYASDGIYGFISDLQRLKLDHRVAVLVFSEFGRRVPENANLGTDHGSANLMFFAGTPVLGGFYGAAPSLTDLVDGDNLAHTTDFRQVYATAIEKWLGVSAAMVLGDRFDTLPVFG